MMISVNQFNLHDCSPTRLLPTKEGHKETQDDVTVWRHLPRHAQQVVQQLLVFLGLGSLPPRVLVEGEEGGAAPVPAPGQCDQLLLHLPHHVQAAETSDKARQHHRPSSSCCSLRLMRGVMTSVAMSPASVWRMMVSPTSGAVVTSGVHCEDSNCHSNILVTWNWYFVSSLCLFTTQPLFDHFQIGVKYDWQLLTLDFIE